ncbi:hypothetical protein NW754_014580 [Fusarium falciforme]|nr:hypothetical protein NW754_014580 [Fusarium falciforme]
MVASEENQRAFITSVVSFINTYDFDGVDIDWRYPTAPQKGGSPDNTKNYVVFAGNLQAALRNNGLRDGLSVTVPAVYSYLQYFDLKQLSDHVDWFNVLAFDLHGAFRSPDSWINNKLNAHTNLTEIADTVDLIWRSDVPSAKVVMGLAFYSRTFTASSTKCVSKGCPFDSAGRGERCSDEIGLVSNADIHHMLSWSGTKPRLDKETAVQVVRYDDQWITYEDETTLQIKLDFARSQCMGGVAVWSVSQDTNSGTYSHALQSAISTVSQVQTPTKPSNQTSLRKRDEGDLKLENVRLDSCRWTNCGGACPSGWTAILRDEEDKEFQTIWEDSGCTTPEVRTWCCPPGEEPKCKWSAWNHGMCMSSCSNGYVEVGSSKIACDSGSQLACCSTKTKDGLIVDSMRIWDKCRWEGEEPVCGPTNGPDEPCSEMQDDRHHRLAKAFMGSGSTTCLVGSKVAFHFENADALDDGHCRAGCPQASSPTGYTKLALSSNGGCESGAAACCCKPTVTRKYDKDTLEAYLESKVAEWVESPTCPADVDKRSTESVSNEASIKVAHREFDPEPSPHEVLEEVVYGFITVGGSNHEYEHVLDAQLTKRWTHITSDDIDIVYRYSATVRDMVKDNRDTGTASLLCRLNEWDDFMGSGGTNKTLTCSLSDLPDELDDEYEAPEIEIPTHDGLKARDHDLAPRAKGEGRARPIVVTVKGNANNKNNKIYWVIWSQPYYYGDKLAEKNKNKKYYMLEFDPNVCAKAKIVYTDQKNGQKTEGEHLPELQTMGDFWGFLCGGRIPAINESIENPLIGEEFVNTLNPAGYGRYWVETYLQTSFARWQAEYGNTSPMDQIFHAIGSQDDTSHMVNTHSVVNNLKAIIWGRKQFIGERKLGRYTRDTSIATT